MNLNIRYYFIFIIFFSSFVYAEKGLGKILRSVIIENGFKSPEYMYINEHENLAPEGEIFFKSNHLSLNGSISCATCHIPSKGSSDGIPNAAGVRGLGEGRERLLSGAKIVPRNTLALWGVGSKDFNTFFWDGKVTLDKDGNISSQFLDSPPSNDPLIVAVHLPFVAIREMIEDNHEISELYKNENINSAFKIYDQLINKINNESSYGVELAKIYDISTDEVSFFHVADSIANFIRSKFAIKKTPFENFVFDDLKLNEEQIRGGLTFYGKGKCSSCHSGKYFSDLNFHSLPMLQLGFGENGFGDDYGRFNMTDNYNDLYKFRTPPLYNVVKTAPYSHSGNYYDLKEVIRAHYDPLKNFDSSKYTDEERIGFFKRIKYSSIKPSELNYLDEKELDDLVEFLKLLSFD